MSRRKKTDGVQDALIPDEMSPLKLLDFNAGNARSMYYRITFSILLHVPYHLR